VSDIPCRRFRSLGSQCGPISHSGKESSFSGIEAVNRTADIEAIRPRQYGPRHNAFRGKMVRRKAPVTNREIALTVMKVRAGPNPTMLSFW
jgi:hypothetical protein